MRSTAPVFLVFITIGVLLAPPAAATKQRTCEIATSDQSISFIGPDGKRSREKKLYAPGNELRIERDGVALLLMSTAEVSKSRSLAVVAEHELIDWNTFHGRRDIKISFFDACGKSLGVYNKRAVSNEYECETMISPEGVYVALGCVNHVEYTPAQVFIFDKKGTILGAWASKKDKREEAAFMLSTIRNDGSVVLKRGACTGAKIVLEKIVLESSGAIRSSEKRNGGDC